MAKKTDESSGSFAHRVSQPLVIPPEELTKPHRFWDQQPVPKLGEAYTAEECHALIPDTDVEKVRKDPLPLPEGFRWCEVDLFNPREAEELYNLLERNYVEDDDACFRFQYSVDCLKWALMSPGYKSQWHVGVRAGELLVAFISAVPATIKIYKDVIKMAEVNFLCVHKKLRSKRLAPVLIREVTRRVNLQNVWQAVYTAGVFLPRPVADCRYYHRSINFKKLVEVGFSHLPPKQTMPVAVRLLALPDAFTLSDIHPMEEKYVEEVRALLLKDFEDRNVHLHPVMDEEEIRHWLLPRPGVLDSYVRLDTSGKVTDFFSYYELPSNVIRHNTKYNSIKVAYNYYTAATSVPLKEILQQALIAAKLQDFDVFNALSLGDNFQTFEELKFGAGDGSLKYYLYNWSCPAMSPAEVGLILM